MPGSSHLLVLAWVVAGAVATSVLLRAADLPRDVGFALEVPVLLVAFGLWSLLEHRAHGPPGR